MSPPLELGVVSIPWSCSSLSLSFDPKVSKVDWSHESEVKEGIEQGNWNGDLVPVD